MTNTARTLFRAGPIATVMRACELSMRCRCFVPIQRLSPFANLRS
ncbi:MAG: hypothetical protein QOG73_3359 [Acetobacteraceae bacterium]|jgi:hypothetical protein|nr:hypothetical protein [Acetobacteraceae bacterium]